MMFTIITIIFLPLSFMSSVFGMNARELSGASGGIMSLRYQFKFMCKFNLTPKSHLNTSNPSLIPYLFSFYFIRSNCSITGTGIQFMDPKSHLLPG